MRWSLDDLPIFAAVIEHRSMTAAAEALGQPKSTVSTAISRLERAVGLRLFDRHSRAIRLTEEGATFQGHVQAILEQVREADAALAGLRAEPSGKLTVALPPAFCQELVAPRLPAFHAAYPQVTLDLVITARGIDLLREQVDLAVVVGRLADSDLVVRTLYAGPLVWVASPDWLSGRNLGPSLAELRRHVQICETRYALPRLPVQVNGEATHIDLSTGLTQVGNPLVVREAVLNGAGIAPLPRHYCRSQIADGSLIEVFGHVAFEPDASTLSAVYPGRRLVSPRLRVFLDFLVEASR